MTTLKIAVLERETLVNRPFAFDFAHSLREFGSIESADTAACIAGADVVITNKIMIDAGMIAANPQLRLIAVSATGVNNVDLEAARAAGVAVCNIRAYGNESVAEHAFMLMIALMRNLPAYQRDVAAGLWQNSPVFCHFGAPMRDLSGKTLVIFGRGGIGNTRQSRIDEQADPAAQRGEGGHLQGQGGGVALEAEAVIGGELAIAIGHQGHLGRAGGFTQRQ